MRRQLDTLRSSTTSQLAVKLGQAYNDLPEWRELTDDERQSLIDAVSSKTDEGEAISTFNNIAFGIVAERRAQKRVNEWKERELAKEREAIRQEEAARLLKDSEAPDLANSKGRPARIDVKTMPQAEFDALWEKMKRGYS